MASLHDMIIESELERQKVYSEFALMQIRNNKKYNAYIAYFGKQAKNDVDKLAVAVQEFAESLRKDIAAGEAYISQSNLTRMPKYIMAVDYKPIYAKLNKIIENYTQNENIKAIRGMLKLRPKFEILYQAFKDANSNYLNSSLAGEDSTKNVQVNVNVTKENFKGQFIDILRRVLVDFQTSYLID